MTNNELIQKLLGSVKRETHLTLEVIRYLAEVEERELHLEMGYPSLFELATKFLKYSDGSAFRRINAHKLMKHVPEVENKIIEGSLSISAAAHVEAFCRKTGADRRKAVQRVEGKSTRDAERALFELVPDRTPEQRVRRVSSTHTEIRIYVNNEQLLQLEKLKQLSAHKNPYMSYSELIFGLVDHALKKQDLEKRQATSAPKSNPETRTARGTVKRVVWQRDQSRCTYVDPVTGHRCDSSFLAETDHIKAWSQGGRTSVDNLRVLCRAHNQYVFRKSTYPGGARPSQSPHTARCPG